MRTSLAINELYGRKRMFFRENTDKPFGTGFGFAAEFGILLLLQSGVNCGVIALIDYGSGNLRSVQKALVKTGANVQVVKKPEELRDARANAAEDGEGTGQE